MAPQGLHLPKDGTPKDDPNPNLNQKDMIADCHFLRDVTEYTAENIICYQWRIYIVKFWTCAPPPGVQILSISCSFWEILAKSYVGAPPGELAPPPRGNPGSATGYIPGTHVSAQHPRGHLLLIYTLTE